MRTPSPEEVGRAADGRYQAATMLAPFLSITLLVFLAPPLLRAVIPADLTERIQGTGTDLAMLFGIAAASGVAVNVLMSLVVHQAWIAWDRYRGNP